MFGLDRQSQQARQFGYGLNYLIDIANAVIVDVEATPARTYDEVAATKTMITRTQQRLGLKAKRLVADTAYGTGKFLGWLIGTGITPHIPVWDKSSREDGTFSRADFTFDRERNVYVCPAGKLLTTTGNVDGDTWCAILPRLDCADAPQAAMLSENALTQGHTRLNEDARDHARLVGTPEFDRSRNERKKVEMRFAHLKTHHRFERMRLRGLSGARDEFHLAAIVQNLKTLRCKSSATTRPAARSICLWSLMITSVGLASKSPPIQRPQNPTAGSTQPDQNDPKHNANRTGYFFNNIDPRASTSAPSIAALRRAHSITSSARVKSKGAHQGLSPWRSFC